MSITLNILGEEYEIQNCVRIPKCIQPKQVTVIPETALICPSCGGKLYTYKPIVPISKTEYINIADIANHLEFLINMSGPSHPDSMEKWKSDLKFITEYKLKHEAFVLI